MSLPLPSLVTFLVHNDSCISDCKSGIPHSSSQPFYVIFNEPTDHFCLPVTYLMMDLMSYLMHIQESIAILSLIGVILASMIVTVIPTNSAQAETGKGEDVFKVIMTIFGVDESKGDVITIVTAKDELAKVKLFDASGPEVVPLNASEGGGHLIEYVATFPNLTINSGDEYKACISTVKDLE